MLIRSFLMAACCLVVSQSISLAEDAKAKAKPAEAAAAKESPAKAADGKEAADKAAKADQAAAKGKAIQKIGFGLLERVMGQFQAAPAPAFRGEVVIKEGGGLAAPAPADQPAENGELDPAEQQMLTQLKPMLNIEIAFARQACGFDKEQAKQLSAAAKDEMKKIAREYLKWQNQPRHVVMVNGVQKLNPEPLDPKKRMREFLTTTIKEKHSEAIVQKYTEELTKRTEFEKQTAVENMVAMLDQELMLDAPQREKLTESLAANWDANWVPQLQYLQHGMSYFPAVPDKVILPVLNKTQKTAWKASKSGRQNHFFFHGDINAPEMIFDFDN
jgi:hypothetical protein